MTFIYVAIDINYPLAKDSAGIPSTDFPITMQSESEHSNLSMLLAIEANITPPVEISGGKPLSTEKSLSKVTLIGAVGFPFVCNQLRTELLFMLYKKNESDAVELLNQEMEPDVDMSTILYEYYKFADLFSKKEADKLPHTKPMTVRSLWRKRRCHHLARYTTAHWRLPRSTLK